MLALPGFGPYATAHIMMLLGRYRGSCSTRGRGRPTHASAAARPPTGIERRFRRYRDYAGLAFWLYLTRDWVADAG